MNFERIIDISYTLEEGMPTYPAPWHPVVEITQLGRLGLEGRQTRKMVLGTHTGTHVDAPTHFIGDGRTVDKLDLQKLVGDVTIVDMSHKKANDIITEEDLKKIHVSKRMIFRFNWFRNWNEKQYYREWPHFTPHAAEYLVGKGMELMGLDSPSPDAWKQTADVDSPVHKVLLKAEVVLLEYLNNLDQANPLDGWTLLALPLKVRDGDGAPARACLVR